MTELFEIHELDAELVRTERETAIRAVQALLPEADVREVGSTAVDGAIGKQDIDLLVRVDRPAFGAARSQLDQHFPRNKAQLSNAEYQGYQVSSPLDVAIQLTVFGGEYDMFLPFLSALKADPVLLEAYNQLKREWHGRPMTDYRAAKSSFIEAVLKEGR